MKENGFNIYFFIDSFNIKLVTSSHDMILLKYRMIYQLNIESYSLS